MPSSYNVHLVVPTNRPQQLSAFLGAWIEKDVWRKIHIVHDAPDAAPLTLAVEATRRAKVDVAVYSWEHIDALTQSAREIFSRRDSAIRCFGFWMAYRNGADYVITLDDDCVRHGETDSAFEFMYSHLTAFHGTRRWASTIPGVPVRGLPFKNKGMTPVDLNMGLWSNVADLSAPEQLVREQRGESLDVPLPPDRRMMPRGQYAPLSGMNLAFTRRAMPFMYFPPMGECQPYSRFDDIWCGLVAQKVMAHLGWDWTCGEPFVRHQRASDTLANLAKEAPGILANEKYWEVIDGVTLTASTAVLAVREIAEALIKAEGPGSYLTKWGQGLLGWLRLLDG